jgi:hypothetical protein
MTKTELMRIKQNTIAEKKHLEQEVKKLYDKPVETVTDLYVYFKERKRVVNSKLKMIKELESVL